MLRPVCLCLFLIVRCWGYQSSWQSHPNHHIIPQDVMTDVVNNLALKMLAIHNEGNNNNIAISPYGALSILVALEEGVQGNAAAEIHRAAQLPHDIFLVRVGLRDIHRHLKSYFIPEEGFLSGLSLSHDNVTLRQEYEDILKFYGFDIDSFNNWLYPEGSTTENPTTITISTSESETSTVEITSSTSDTTQAATTISQDEERTTERVTSTTERITSTTEIGESTTGIVVGKMEVTTSVTEVKTSTTEIKPDITVAVTTTEAVTISTTQETTTAEATTLQVTEATTEAARTSTVEVSTVTTEQITNAPPESTTMLQTTSVESSLEALDLKANELVEMLDDVSVENMTDANSTKQANLDESKANYTVRRDTRSILDYIIARYYDDHSVTQRPPPYVSESDLYFLVNGKYKESNINYMTYDTVLPFHFVTHLNALALRFPLDSSSYYLLLLLPENPQQIDKLICDLRLNINLKYVIDNLRYTHVKAVIPSFMLKGYTVLTPTFQKMGIRRVFEPRQADFSPMTSDRDIYVTNIEQAITINIRNYMDPTTTNNNRYLHRIEPVLFKADHPFLFFVMDSELDVALMAGKIINPLNSRIR